MNEVYLKFHELKTRSIHENEIGKIDLDEFDYLHYDKPNYKLKDNYYIGSIDKKDSFGFVRQEEDDIYVDGRELKDVMNNDVLLVKGDDRAKVVLIVKRALNYIVATVKKRRHEFKFFTDKPLYKDIKVDDTSKLVGGHVVKLEVKKISRRKISTTLSEIIGHINDPDIDINKIVAEHDWPDFDQKPLINEIMNLNIDYDKEFKERLNLEDEFTFTIDGKEAKDLDDAISVEYKDGLYHLGVHIADVSFFVKEGGLIDEAAYIKSTSVYMANKVIPMLPHKLSNDLCSLNVDEPKLAMSCIMQISKEGKVVDYQLAKTVIKTKHRLNYEETNNFLEKDVSLGNKILDQKLTLMNELSNILATMRKARGEIEFESEEIRFKFDQKGRVTKVYSVKTGKAEELIESFMLIANETVAYHMEENDIPSLYRIHEKPDPDKLKQAATRLQRIGVKFDKSKIDKPSELQKITRNIKGDDNQFVVNMTLLRAMQRAKYDPKPVGHFGLAAKHYTHFTAPIRRYPDLLLHRLIKELVLSESNNIKSRKKYYEDNLAQIAEHTSTQERVAIDIERDVNKLMSCKYLKGKIGKHFSGQIIQMLRSGMFVRLENGIEGYIPVRDNYQNSYFDQDLVTYRINNTHYHIGQKVDVKLENVDMLEKEIDFSIVKKKDKQKKDNKNKKHGKRRGKKRRRR